MDRRSRPTGITVLAILQAIGGVFIILSGLALIGSRNLPDLARTDAGAALAAVALPLGIFSLIVGIISLVLCYGLWQLKGWAWMGTLIIQGLNILQGVIQLVNGATTNIIGIAIAAAIVYYLLRPEIKGAFGK